MSFPNTKFQLTKLLPEVERGLVTGLAFRPIEHLVVSELVTLVQAKFASISIWTSDPIAAHSWPSNTTEFSIAGWDDGTNWNEIDAAATDLVIVHGLYVHQALRISELRTPHRAVLGLVRLETNLEQRLNKRPKSQDVEQLHDQFDGMWLAYAPHLYHKQPGVDPRASQDDVEVWKVEHPQ